MSHVVSVRMNRRRISETKNSQASCYLCNMPTKELVQFFFGFLSDHDNDGVKLIQKQKFSCMLRFAALHHTRSHKTNVISINVFIFKCNPFSPATYRRCFTFAYKMSKLNQIKLNYFHCMLHVFWFECQYEQFAYKCRFTYSDIFHIRA